MTRVGVAMLVACLGACGFHSPQQQVPGDSGTSIDSVSGGGLDDSDGDGVDDPDDNCPGIANLDQHDEDRDTVGDVCDPCPQVANATADGDGDGIADACDPHPSLSGDMLVKFEPFAGSGNLPMGWQSKGGGTATDWKRGNDALTIAADNATRIAIFNSGSPRHAIDIGLEITGAVGGGLQFLTGLTDVKSDIREFFGCGMRFDNQLGGRTREMFAFNEGDNPPFVTLTTDPSEVPAASGPYRIQFVMEGDNELCVIPNGADPHRQANGRDSHGNTYVGLRANNVTVVFRYVAVYKF